jgi:hypothetical protein
MSTDSKPSRLTPEQIAELDLARKSDLSNDDWVELYLSEFPEIERRDVGQLKKSLRGGRLVMHETRDKHGQLLTWSMTSDHPAPEGSDEPSFWLGCWTVTRRSAQSTGIGRVHFAHLLATLKKEKPNYIGRVTEIESTEGMAPDSQPVRRAKFYKALGLMELDITYEIPLFQPPGAKRYIPQTKLGPAVKAQLLMAPFCDKPIVLAAQARSIVSQIYGQYNVRESDPYIAQRLSVIDDHRQNLLIPVRLLSQDASAAALSAGENACQQVTSVVRSASTDTGETKRKSSESKSRSHKTQRNIKKKTSAGKGCLQKTERSTKRRSSGRKRHPCKTKR